MTHGWALSCYPPWRGYRSRLQIVVQQHLDPRDGGGYVTHVFGMCCGCAESLDIRLWYAAATLAL